MSDGSFFYTDKLFFASPASAGEVPNEVRRRGSCFVFPLVSHVNMTPKTPSVCCAATSPGSPGEAIDGENMSRQTRPRRVGCFRRRGRLW